LFEDATRVPLIFAGPGILKNQPAVQDPVELVDLYPTIMDMVQMQTPQFVQGKSLAPYMKESIEPIRTSALTELQVHITDATAQGYSIKTKRYRLTKWQYKEDSFYELYDHKRDANELINLAGISKYKSLKDSLSLVLEKRVLAANIIPKDLGRQIEDAIPYFEPEKLLPKKK